MRPFYLLSVQPPINNQTSEATPFYKILQVLEVKAGLTEKEVIQRLEIPRSTYRSWKDGTSEPSRRIYWRKLSEAFGVHLDQLIFGTLPFSQNTQTNGAPNRSEFRGYQEERLWK